MVSVILYQMQLFKSFYNFYIDPYFVMVCATDMEDVLNALAQDQDKYQYPSMGFFIKEGTISCRSITISIGTKQYDCNIVPNGSEFLLSMELSQVSGKKQFNSVINAVNYFLQFHDLTVDCEPLNYVKVDGRDLATRFEEIFDDKMNNL